MRNSRTPLALLLGTAQCMHVAACHRGLVLCLSPLTTVPTTRTHNLVRRSCLQPCRHSHSWHIHKSKRRTCVLHTASSLCREAVFGVFLPGGVGQSGDGPEFASTCVPTTPGITTPRALHSLDILWVAWDYRGAMYCTVSQASQALARAQQSCQVWVSGGVHTHDAPSQTTSLTPELLPLTRPQQHWAFPAPMDLTRSI